MLIVKIYHSYYSNFNSETHFLFAALGLEKRRKKEKKSLGEDRER